VKSLHIDLLSVLALALALPACEARSVPPWPYTLAPGNGGEDATAPAADAAPDDAPSDDGGAAGAANQDGSSGPSISNNYTIPPLRCDGGLCDTDNYSLCDLAGNPSATRAVRPLSLLAAIGAISIARRRRRRRMGGS
jgi:hypothetical protein